MPPPRQRSPLTSTALPFAAACAALLALGACRFWRKPPPDLPALANPALDARLATLLRYDVPAIGVDSLRRVPPGEVLLLDARPAGEYAVSHIAGAVRVDPAGPLPAWIDTLPRERQVTVYCSVGYRSENVARRLGGAGFTKVNNLYGSLFDWVDRGLPVVDSAGRPTRRVHTYNRRWGRLLTRPDVEKVW